MDDLHRTLAAIRRRLILRRLVDWAAWGLLAGLGLVALVLLVSKFLPFPMDLPLVGGGIVAACVLSAAVAALIRWGSLFEAALRADAHLGLQERLSSAWILSRQERHRTGAYATLLEDAAAHARSIHPRRDFRCPFPRHARHTIWPALGIVALLFLPQFPLFQGGGEDTPPSAAEPARAAMTAEERTSLAEALRELAREDRLRKEDAGDGQVDLAERFERLARDLELGNRNRLESMAEMSRMSEDVRVEQREAERKRQPFRQISGLQQANQTRDLQRALKDNDFEQAAREMNALIDQMADMGAEDINELARELERLAENLSENKAMSEALEQAAQALQDYAEQQSAAGQDGASGDGSAQPSLSPEAAEALRQAAAQAQQSMREAGVSMEEMERLATQMQQLSQIRDGLEQCMGQCANPGAGQEGREGERGAIAAGQGEGSGEGGQEAGRFGEGEGGDDANGQMVSQPGESGRPSAGTQAGTGSGGQGPGTGPRPSDPAADVTFQDVFIPGDQHEGEIIAVFEGEGLVPAGESRLDYRQVPAEVRQRSARSIDDTRIPAGHRGTVRDYFEAIHFGEE